MGSAMEMQLTNLTNVESSCACIIRGIKPTTYHLPVDLGEVGQIGGGETAHKFNQCAE